MTWLDNGVVETRSDSRSSSDPDAVRVLPPIDGSLNGRPVPTSSSSAARTGPALLAAMAAIGAVLLVALLAPSAEKTEGGSALSVTNLPRALSAAVGPIDAGRIIDATSAWTAGEGITDAGAVADVAFGRGVLVAVGSADTRAAVWGSRNGDRWTPATMIGVPEGAVSQIDAAAEWAGDWIAIGTVDGEPAIWRARSWRNWEFDGLPNELSNVDEVVDIVAGSGRFWLVASEDNRQALWFSTDGSSWSKRDIGIGPDDVVVAAATTGAENGEWLYVAGNQCRDSVCRPAVWMTRSGLSWIGAEAAAGLPAGEIADAPGEVKTIAATARRIVAAGHTQVGALDVPAFWTSRDGVKWSPASNAASFSPSEVRVRLHAVSAGDPGTVSLLISGRQVDAAAGDMVLTEVGELVVVGVEGTKALLRFGSETYQLGRGSWASLQVDRRIEHMAADADRIVAIGFESKPDGTNRVPVAWTSTNGPDRWEIHRLDDSAETPTLAGICNDQMVALSGAGSTWVHNWDVEAAAASAVGVVTRFIGAIADRDLAAVIGSLPWTRPNPGGDVEVPGLTHMEWWGEDDGRLDPAAVAGAVAFLEELNTALSVSECVGKHRWGDEGGVRVDCHFRVSSDFLTTMGLAESTGMLSAMVTDGEVENLTAPGRADSWHLLARWARNTDPEGSEPVFGSDRAAVSPPPDAAMAGELLAWARRYRESVLQPGEAMETTTPIGSIVWSLEQPFDQPTLSWLVEFRGAFWAVTADEADGLTSNPQLWTSRDAILWESVGAAQRMALGDPMVFAGRLAIVSHGDGGPRITEWDGTRWIGLEIGPYPAVGEWWLESLAESSGRVLFVSNGWDSTVDRPLGSVVWALSPDDRFEPITIDGPDLSSELRPMLTAWDSGFAMLLESTGHRSGVTREVWHSGDGTEWELLTNETGIDGHVEWFGTRGHDLAAQVFGGEECEPTGDGLMCRPVWQQWSSSDGIVWEHDPAGDLNVVAESASGALGTIAITHGYFEWGLSPEPVSVLMAADDGPLQRVDDLHIGVPLAEFYRIGDIAMSADTVAAAIRVGSGMMVTGQDPVEQVWLLVGRLVDR